MEGWRTISPELRRACVPGCFNEYGGPGGTGVGSVGALGCIRFVYA